MRTKLRDTALIVLGILAASATVQQVTAIDCMEPETNFQTGCDDCKRNVMGGVTTSEDCTPPPEGFPGDTPCIDETNVDFTVCHENAEPCPGTQNTYTDANCSQGKMETEEECTLTHIEGESEIDLDDGQVCPIQ